MISPMKLIKMEKKWQSLAALRQKRASYPRAAGGTTKGVDKGHFVVYTSDEIRFVIPLDYLKNSIFQELLKMAEEEYGLQSDGPIRLPFEATFMEYVVSMMDRNMDKDLQKALIMSITSSRCLLTSNAQLQKIHSELLISSF